MKIALFSTGVMEYGGGFENYLIEMAAYLSSHHQNIDIITMDNNFSIKLNKILKFYYFKNVDSSVILKNDLNSIRSQIGNSKYTKVKNVSELKALLNKYDVIYSKNEIIEAFIFKYYIGYANVPPIIFGCHTTLKYPKARSIQAKIHNLVYSGLIYKHLSSGVKKFHSINISDNNIASALFKGRDVKIIYNPFDFKKFRNLANKHDKSIVKKNIKSIVWVGRLTEQKGVLDLVKTIQIVNRSCKDKYDFEWLIAGDGELRNYIKSEAPYDNVNLLGHLTKPDVSTLLSDSDLFISTSMWEGYPYNILEAIAHNMPIAAYAIPGILEISQKYTGLKTVENVHKLSNLLVNWIKEEVEFEKRDGSIIEAEIEPKKIYSHLLNYMESAV